MSGRVYYFILFLFSLVVAERASAQAVFTGGPSQSLTVCQDAGAVAINDLLAASDMTTGVTVNWTVVLNAAHGALVASYSTISTGSVMTPIGLTYTPATGFSGNDSFKVQVSDGIGSMTTTVHLTVVPLPDAGIITGLSTVCAGNTISLASTGSGGIWSSSSVNATVDAAGVVTGATAGTATISYSLSNICGTSAATHGVTVNAAPAANTIGGATDVCAGSSTTLSTSGTGGVWSSSTPGVATINSLGAVSGVATGTTTISYSVTTSCGASVATHVMTVSASAIAGSIIGASTVCETGAIGLFATAPGGTWSSSDVTIAEVGSSTGIVTGMSGGSVLISYTVSNSCGAVVTTSPITVNPLPTIAPITGITTICGGIPSTLSNTTSGGTWSSANPSIASISSIGVVTGASSGTVIVSYSKSNSCGIKASTTVIHVGPPVAGTILGSYLVCQGTATNTLTTTSVGGTWSSSNPAVGTVYPLLDGNVVVGGVSVGISTITYAVVGTCATSIATFVISVQPAPTPAPISGTPVVCQYATTSLSGAIAGGVWSSGAPGIGTVSTAGVVTGVSGGMVPISYTVYDPACGTQTAIKVVTVNTTPPVPVIITDTMRLCQADTMTVFNPAPGGTWSSSFTGIATVVPTVSVTGSAGFISGLTPGVDTIYYTLTNGCGPNRAKLVLTIDSLPDPGVIIGTGELCSGGSSLFTPSRTGGTWSTSFASVATVSGGLVGGVSAGTAIITYRRTNGCGSSAAVSIVTVNSVPYAGVISANKSSVCPGMTALFTSTATGGVWSVSAGGASSINPTTGAFTGVTAGNPIISYTVTNDCGSAVTTSTIRVRTAADCIPPAGAEELTGVSGAELKLFPNPSNGTFKVMLASATDEDVTVTVSNVAGQKVNELVTATNKEAALQMNVAAGLYFISARTADGKYYTAKMVVTE